MLRRFVLVSGNIDLAIPWRWVIHVCVWYVFRHVICTHIYHLHTYTHTSMATCVLLCNLPTLYREPEPYHGVVSNGWWFTSGHPNTGPKTQMNWRAIQILKKKHMLISLGCASMFEVYTFDKANKKLWTIHQWHIQITAKSSRLIISKLATGLHLGGWEPASTQANQHDWIMFCSFPKASQDFVRSNHSPFCR